MSKTLLFTSPTCAPCKMLKMDLAANGVGSDLTLVDISLPENVPLLDTYGIRSVPTMILVDDDEEVIRVRVGYTGRIDEVLEFLDNNYEKQLEIRE